MLNLLFPRVKKCSGKFVGKVGIGSGVSIDDAFSMIDVQANHCTTGQFKGQVDPELSPTSMFSVQHLRATGS